MGFIVMQHSERRNQPVRSYNKWIARIPAAYREYVLDEPSAPATTVKEDPNCLAVLKHYRSLISMAQESRKPLFSLKPADGAIGAHSYAVRDAYADFRELALKIAHEAGASGSL